MKSPKLRQQLLALALCAAVVPVFAKKPAPADPDRPKIEVCFVLDTTGSMGGLIEGAKDKIWSIANEMVAAKPTPEIRFGLIGYRDKGDAYVTKVDDLTDDIDDIYTKLMKFEAQGGGDTPESVNQALNEAVTKMSWSESRDVLKLIFLVGDAPPHMDYQDDVKYPEVCQAAMKKDLIINTIQCGRLDGTAAVWQEIASKAEGEYAAIQQDGGAVAIATPFDAEISEINRKLNATVVGYGTKRDRAVAVGKTGASVEGKSEATADRAAFFSLSAAPAVRGKVITGKEDLLGLIADGEVDYDGIETEKLPEELRELSQEERKAHIVKLQDERKDLQAEMQKLAKQRSEFLETEKKRLAAAGEVDSFDTRVKRAFRAQAESKGIKFE